MNSSKIRSIFLDFFKQKEHEIVSSAPMVIKNDPTLMFTNAGMNQFKDLFLGNSKAKYPRVSNSQKCLRVSGKHNDLEEVGVDTYHHTMFEMLGNWSFGNYFKKEAIAWAWELLTEVYKIDKENLYVTIFGGDEEDGTSEDKEAVEIWKNYIAEDRILPFDKKDNFWEMGETGPCGPCSEIHVDIRSEEEKAKIPGHELVNKDHPQVIEIWNLVFMQYNRMKNKSLVNLPNKHVDTGMGFERLAMILQGKQSNYDTDVFSELIERISKLSGVTYKQSDDKMDVAIRVIADHVRAVAFSIADGQLPSNTGAGYVIRRILRRAIRYGFSFLNLKRSFIHELVPILVSQMGGHFPELKAQETLIERVIHEEEESFLKTLEKGIERFEQHAKTAGEKIDGKFAFELYDTFGFPIDLTELMAVEKGLHVDKIAFDTCLEEQKTRSRKATALETLDWVILREDDVEEFVGYDRTSSDIFITRYRSVNAKGKSFYQLVFNFTPFYAEGGGQVGDTGFIEAGGKKIYITNTKKENNLILHYADELPENPEVKFHAKVDAEKRKYTASNHSATHLLHQALREVLGTHVEQKGSLVSADHLRFDFSHFSKVTKEEIATIEAKVNERIRTNIVLEEQREVPMAEAMEMGAMALFGEKYSDLVRVIKFGESVELCGGIHVPSTGNIGLFKITHETAVAAGIRRIEAITSIKADAYIQETINVVEEIKNTLKSKDILKSIADLKQKNTALEKEIEQLKKERAKGTANALKREIKNINGAQVIAKKVELDAASIKNLAFSMKQEFPSLFLVLGSQQGEKATLMVCIGSELAKAKDLHAGNIVREAAKAIQGGGGGQPEFAIAGGKNPAGIEEAIEAALNHLN